jgi:D-glycero-D-manno-heptose 1,7-bisphosphate phosphatase
MMEVASHWIVLDRDGVINQDSSAFIKSPDEWRPLPGSLEAIARLSRAGFAIAVATNQSGVGRGLYSEATLGEIHACMLAAIAEHGGKLEGIYSCIHRPDEACECRKPRPGLLRQIERDSGRALIGAPLIGDRLADLQAAEAVGARPILVRTGSGQRTLAVLGAQNVEVYADLAEAADALLKERGHSHP